MREGGSTPDTAAPGTLLLTLLLQGLGQGVSVFGCRDSRWGFHSSFPCFLLIRLVAGLAGSERETERKALFFLIRVQNLTQGYEVIKTVATAHTRKTATPLSLGLLWFVGVCICLSLLSQGAEFGATAVGREGVAQPTRRHMVAGGRARRSHRACSRDTWSTTDLGVHWMIEGGGRGGGRHLAREGGLRGREG